MRTKLIGSMLTVAILVSSGRAADPIVVKLWPNQAPGETGVTGQEKITKSEKIYQVTNVTSPTLTIFHPDKANDTGTALIIAPGGAFRFLSWDIEGENIAKWCNSIGVTGIILKYRVPRTKDNPLAAFQDGQRAVSLVRGRSAEWGINPQRIGMIGFSAGGGVTNYVLLNTDKRAYEPVDESDKISTRLNYGVLIYSAGGFGSPDGKNNLDATTITKDKVPPIFFCAAYDDGIAANMMQSFIALKKAGVPAEIHIYAAGGHGFGIRAKNNPLVADWPKRLEAWMRHQKLLEQIKAP